MSYMNSITFITLSIAWSAQSSISLWQNYIIIIISIDLYVCLLTCDYGMESIDIAITYYNYNYCAIIKFFTELSLVFTFIEHFILGYCHADNIVAEMQQHSVCKLKEGGGGCFEWVLVQT